MFSGRENELSTDLLTVFRLCNPDRLGRIKIEFLQELASDFTDFEKPKNNVKVSI